jgi:hypothetical protein
MTCNFATLKKNLSASPPTLECFSLSDLTGHQSLIISVLFLILPELASFDTSSPH